MAKLAVSYTAEEIALIVADFAMSERKVVDLRYQVEMDWKTATEKDPGWIRINGAEVKVRVVPSQQLVSPVAGT